MDLYYITNKVHPHWVKHEPLNVGDTLSTGFPNPFFNFFLNSNFSPMQVKTENGMVNYTRMQWLYGVRIGSLTTESPANVVATFGHEMAMHFCKYTRELIWESVRVEGYPDKPSRQKCIWLSQGEENVNYWLKQLGSEDNRVVFRVEIDGVTHEASDEFLMRDDIPYNLAKENANRYWKGEIINPISREILFEGRMKILEQCK